MSSQIEEGEYSIEIDHYKLGIQDLFVRKGAERTTLYKRAGTTVDPEVVVDHDGPVLYDGNFRYFEKDDGVITGYHPYAGRREFISPHDKDFSALLLEKVERA